VHSSNRVFAVNVKIFDVLLHGVSNSVFTLMSKEIVS
jgi:hypothetical protein